jgi:hypothetical protein
MKNFYRIMKKIVLISLAIIANVTVCLSQGSSTEEGRIGASMKISPDKRFLEVTFCYKGSPADMLGLQVSDRIYKIDDEAVSDLTDPISHVRGTPGTWVKLTIDRFGHSHYFDIKVPRISIPFADDNYISEGYLLAHIHLDDFTNHKLMTQSTMTLLDDDSRDIFKYKTYDFEYTSVADPLLEKELFNELGRKLDGMGMHRSQENPDLVIIMDSYTGQKEQYTPPQQIISTRIQRVYDWYWGYSVPVPITETTTKEGYTEVTYLTTIKLKFLDAKEIANSKIPPVVWSGSISETSNTKKNLTDCCADYFALMLYQFPKVWFQNSDYYYIKYYSYTGLWFNKNDLRIIAEVIPGSPAYETGMRKGDKILSINGYRIPAKYSDVESSQRWTMADGGIQSGFRYLFMFSNLVFKPYKTPNTTLRFKVERNRERITFDVTPKKPQIFLLIKNK